MRYPVCKDCLQKSVDLNNMKTIFDILRKMDVAFVPKQWETIVINNPKNPLGNYLRVMNTLPIYKNLTFQEEQIRDVNINNKELLEKAGIKKGIEEIKEEKDNPNSNELSKSDILKENALKEFWGDGFSFDEYLAMQHKYDELKKYYPGTTAFHIEGLRNYVIPRVKADICMARGNDGQAKSWLEIADKAAKAAKINISQLSKGDIGGGLGNFSSWSKAVETTANVGDMIKIMDTFRYSPIDSVDFEIWCLINFYRNINGKSEIPYKDVYQFYDKMKSDYINETGDPYGIFDGDTTPKMREKISLFIQPLKEENERE